MNHLKIAYFGYCRDCREWTTLEVKDVGFNPSEPDMKKVCPVDYEHEVDHIEAFVPKEDKE